MILRLLKQALLATTLVLALTLGGCSISPSYTPDPFDVIHAIKPGEIFIRGNIDSITLKEFYNQTRDPMIREYRVVIDTNGGDGYACTGIVSRMVELQREGVTFTTVTYSKAFSAGFYIFMTGDNRIMYQGAQLMAHTAGGQHMYNGAAPHGYHNTRGYMIGRLDSNIIRFILGRHATPETRMTLETMMAYSGMIFIDADDARTLGLIIDYVETN